MKLSCNEMFTYRIFEEIGDPGGSGSGHIYAAYVRDESGT